MLQLVYALVNTELQNDIWLYWSGITFKKLMIIRGSILQIKNCYHQFPFNVNRRDTQTVFNIDVFTCIYLFRKMWYSFIFLLTLIQLKDFNIN